MADERNNINTPKTTTFIYLFSTNVHLLQLILYKKPID